MITSKLDYEETIFLDSHFQSVISVLLDYTQIQHYPYRFVTAATSDSGPVLKDGLNTEIPKVS